MLYDLFSRCQVRCRKYGSRFRKNCPKINFCISSVNFRQSMFIVKNKECFKWKCSSRDLSCNVWRILIALSDWLFAEQEVIGYRAPIRLPLTSSLPMGKDILFNVCCFIYMRIAFNIYSRILLQLALYNFVLLINDFDKFMLIALFV